MSKAVRRLTIAVGVILTIVVILVGVWQSFLRRSFPKANGTVQIDGLSAPVDIYRDNYGVAHIYAQTAEDLFFAQGYVHAQDRFWQMEFWRRIGMGRLSEYFGEATLGTDVYLRTMGFARVAEAEYANADPDTRRILDAYTAGVNTYILNRKPAQLGLEFALLELQGVDVVIEPWAPEHSLAWGHIMSQDLGGNMDDELYRLNLIREVGTVRAYDLMPPFREGFPYIVPDEELDYLQDTTAGADLSYLDGVNTQLVGDFDPSQPLAFGRGQDIGSNNWVISGDLTTTGTPLLANDPHLGVRMPSIWYEVGLHCIDVSVDCPFNVRGYSFAGVPAVIIGHNDHIAWGMTNVNPDVQDLYIERLNPEDINQYEVNGEWVDMDIRYEEIVVQGEDNPVVIPVRSTRHGPIITDMSGYSEYAQVATNADQPEITVLALRWTALDQNSTYEAIFGINKARNYDEFREALSHFDSPSQNLVYADVDGNIGYQMPGLVPIRANGDGSLPVPGWTDDYEWTGFIPYDELPRAYNPAQGYIVTANQPVVSPAYPYLILYQPDFDAGYRAKQITDMITGDTDGIDMDDIAAIQGDTLNLFATELIPYLKNLALDDPLVSAARDHLLAWDGQQTPDSAEAAIYNFFWVALIHDTFGDELSDDLLPGSSDATMNILHYLLAKPDDLWWDDITTPEHEDRDDILARALQDGLQTGTKTLGDNMEKWQWGDIHTVTFQNETFGESGINLLEAIFNRGPFPAPGGAGMVNNVSWRLSEPYVTNSLPSMRQIIDLGDLSQSLMVHTTGQSGHPGHRHYDDFISLWLNIEYHPTNWLREAVEAASRQHLKLVPAR